MVGILQPLTEIVTGQPAAPADLKPLIEIKLVDRESDIAGGKQREDADFPDEPVPILFLKRVVKAVVPLVQENVDPDQRKLDRNHRREQRAARPFVLGTKLSGSDPPYGPDR